MFENGNGKLHYAGQRAHQLWPGPMKPGLWHSALSRMGMLLRSCYDDEEEQAQTAAGGHRERIGARVPLPPVFDGCSVLVKEAEQQRARDLYWDVVCNRWVTGGQ